MQGGAARDEGHKEGRVIKHSKTGEVLDVETIETGLIEIKDVRDKTAVGVILQETNPNSIVYGTMVRSSNKDSLGEERVESMPDRQQDLGEHDSFLRRIFRRTKPQKEPSSPLRNKGSHGERYRSGTRSSCAPAAHRATCLCSS
jgi:hypothetical protein